MPAYRVDFRLLFAYLAFLAGMFLYGSDMIPLVGTFSLWAFGIHSFFVFKWFQGQRALKDLNEAEVSTF